MVVALLVLPAAVLCSGCVTKPPRRRLGRQAGDRWRLDRRAGRPRLGGREKSDWRTRAPKRQNEAMSESPVVDQTRVTRAQESQDPSHDPGARNCGFFREQGYDATTVEQIAEAAEVSPQHLLPLFSGAKEDVVIYDALDPILIEAWRRQPAELGLIPGLRAAMHEVFGALSPEELAELRLRGQLVYGISELSTGDDRRPWFAPPR